MAPYCICRLWFSTRVGGTSSRLFARFILPSLYRHFAISTKTISRDSCPALTFSRASFVLIVNSCWDISTNAWTHWVLRSRPRAALVRKGFANLKLDSLVLRGCIGLQGDNFSLHRVWSNSDAFRDTCIIVHSLSNVELRLVVTQRTWFVVNAGSRWQARTFRRFFLVDILIYVLGWGVRVRSRDSGYDTYIIH